VAELGLQAVLVPLIVFVRCPLAGLQVGQAVIRPERVEGQGASGGFLVRTRIGP